MVAETLALWGQLGDAKGGVLLEVGVCWSSSVCHELIPAKPPLFLLA